MATLQTPDRRRQQAPQTQQVPQQQQPQPSPSTGQTTVTSGAPPQIAPMKLNVTSPVYTQAQVYDHGAVLPVSILHPAARPAPAPR